MTAGANVRIVEDVVEAGRRALLRAARENEPQRQQIDAAADWLLERARELRAGAA